MIGGGLVIQAPTACNILSPLNSELLGKCSKTYQVAQIGRLYVFFPQILPKKVRPILTLGAGLICYLWKLKW